jgi:hypothetical protein
LLLPVCPAQQQTSTAANAASAKEGAAMPSERGRILGIGGIFFKSANQQQMREWYGKHLGLADKGQGAMMPWREKDNPDKEHVTVWTVFPGNTKHFEPSQAFMVNYIVDDLDALLERLLKEGVCRSAAASSFRPIQARPTTDLSSAAHSPTGFSCPARGSFQRSCAHAASARGSFDSAQSANKLDSAEPDR